MQLVDEEDHVSGPAHVPENGLDPVLKITPILGACEHRRDVQGHDAFAAEVRGRLAPGHRKGQPLRHGGLAHARLPDEDGIVFAAPGEDLDGAADLGGAAHHGVDEAACGAVGQVQTVLVEDTRLRAPQRRAQGPGLGAAPGVGVAEDIHDGSADVVEVHPRPAQGPHRAALVQTQKTQQQVLCADAAVAQGLGLFCCLLEGFAGVGRQPQPRRAGAAQAGFPDDHAAKVLTLQPLAPEDMRAETVLLLQNAEQQVLGADVGVAQFTGGSACGLDGDLRPLGKFFVALHRASLPLV